MENNNGKIKCNLVEGEEHQLNSLISPVTSNLSNRSTNNNHILLNILTGQFIAILGVLNGLTATTLEKSYKLEYPVFLTASYYLTLFLLYFGLYRDLRKPKLSYIFIVIFDTQANFFNIYAFSKVNFNFPFVINISSFFWTVILSFAIIRNQKYNWKLFLGILTTMLGVSLSLYGMWYEIEQSQFWDNLSGMIFCFISSICYALYLI